MEKVLARQLPVSARAYEMTQRLLYVGELPDGWTVRGKTGTGYQMQADGTPDITRQVGWFVGWAAKGTRTVVFVYAVGDEAGPADTCRPAGARELHAAATGDSGCAAGAALNGLAAAPRLRNHGI